MAFTTAIFDLDGLLVDTEPIAWQAYRAMLGYFDKDMDLATYAQHFSGGTKERNAQLLVEMYRLPVSADRLLEERERREPDYAQDPAPLKPGVRELLEWLDAHGVRSVLATSSGSDRAGALLSMNGVSDYFGLRAYGDEVAHSKPAPDVFLLAAERAGAEPAECVVFEDSEAGVRAGAAAGMRVVCVPDMRRPAPEVAELAYAVIDSLADAPALLEGLL